MFKPFEDILPDNAELANHIEDLEDHVTVLETQVKLLIQAMEQATALINLLKDQQDEQYTDCSNAWGGPE